MPRQLLALDALLLTPEESQTARQQIELMAYYRWLDAGCPENDSLEHWREAELEWIEYLYVPNRDQR